MNLDDVIEDLVERSKLGEQNATAQLAVLGEQYRAGMGGESVRQSYGAALRYLRGGRPRRRLIRRQPLSPTGHRLLSAMAGFGAEPAAESKRCGLICALPLHSPTGLYCAVLVLAAGPSVYHRLPAAVNALSTPEAQESFLGAARGQRAGTEDPYAFAGSAYRKAFALQRLRQLPRAMPEDFEALEPGMGWELGG